MGTNCAPLLADLFLHSLFYVFLDKLAKEGKRKLARKFNLSYRYIDDLISLNNQRFNEFISDIYPKELNISETTEFTSVASYLDLLFTTDENNSIVTKLYVKRDAFGFHIANFCVYVKQYFISTTKSMDLSSFAMPVVVQIIVTFYHATGP